MSAFQYPIEEGELIVFLNERAKIQKDEKILPVLFYGNIFFSVRKICYRNYTRNVDIYYDIYAFMTKTVNIIN